VVLGVAEYIDNTLNPACSQAITNSDSLRYSKIWSISAAVKADVACWGTRLNAIGKPRKKCVWLLEVFEQRHPNERRRAGILSANLSNGCFIHHAIVKLRTTNPVPVPRVVGLCQQCSGIGSGIRFPVQRRRIFNAKEGYGK
jgi:hypothetical protein